MRFLAGLFLTLSVAFAALAQDAPRHALIIANRGYSEAVGPLANTHEDADIVAAALRETGFDVVVETEQSRVATLAALRAHARRVASGGPGAIGLFYYAGHGAADLESARNYLIPVDVEDASTLALWDASIPLPEIQRRLTRAAPGAHHFIVFDACRNELELSERDIAARGFVPEISQGGVFVAFSTAPQRPASDGSASEVGGPYANAFAAEIRRASSRDAVQFFEEVRYAVRDQTDRQQLPWSVNGLGERVYLFGRGEADVGDVDGETDTASAATSDADASAFAAFIQAQQLDTIAAYETFLRHYGDSRFADDAQARIAALEASRAEVDDPAPVGDPEDEAEAAAREAIVREVQQLLTDMGYQPGPVDGQPGSRTLAAVRAFRAAIQIGESDEINESLVERMRVSSRSGHRAMAMSSAMSSAERTQRLMQLLESSCLNATRIRVEASRYTGRSVSVRNGRITYTHIRDTNPRDDFDVEVRDSFDSDEISYCLEIGQFVSCSCREGECVYSEEYIDGAFDEREMRGSVNFYCRSNGADIVQLFEGR